MISQTPATTPLQNSENKKLPLIVDVALDNNGKQLYQVHESTKLYRKEMPRSTNFTATCNAPMVDINEATPIRSSLGTMSPTSVPARVTFESDDLDVSPISSRRAGALFSKVNDPSELGLSSSSSGTNDNDIWSEDVEQAFEEVLKIIPKNGLNKIKLAGRSCGRNELISDYILTKTGKFRTRKQISSHIQVIKNLGQNAEIIDLINDGPIYTSKREQDEANKKFEDIFSKINLNKSLGISESIKTSAPTTGMPPAKRMKTRRNPRIHFHNFYMTTDDPYSKKPLILSIQPSNEDVQCLRLKNNVNMSNRFPGLDEFKNCSDIPIIHNMVKLVLGKVPEGFSIGSGFKSTFSLKSDDPSGSSIQLNSFNNICSYGKQILKFNQTDIHFNVEQDFLISFWKRFLNGLATKSELQKASAFKGLTIKQILYEAGPTSIKHGEDASLIAKSKIKCVILWEFAKVNELKDAITTTSNLILPSPQITAPNDNIVSQVFNHSSTTMPPISNPNWSVATANSTFSTAQSAAASQLNTASSIIVEQASAWDHPQGKSQNKLQFQSGVTTDLIMQPPNASLYHYPQISTPTGTSASVSLASVPQQMPASVPVQASTSHPSANMDLMMLSGNESVGNYGAPVKNEEYEIHAPDYSRDMSGNFN
ncbi:uncharacterized protein J8A68_002021 [[Candida] subhashii]|uniref:TEA domain-containing protein n=1 Tax=[Candida] subhashii TaxID=561895 RepID=A0A8J5QZT5_9ASCO|nr:uncharacterized protein J8A68_002021 [[Candida] subhashii]KAG7664465.1 hypothetical protein J8A68_002021 [[Candida] subhashii]